MAQFNDPATDPGALAGLRSGLAGPQRSLTLDEAVHADGLRAFARHLGEARRWHRGIHPGGEYDDPPKPLSEVPAAKRLHDLALGSQLPFALRQFEESEMYQLRQCGHRIQEGGVLAIDRYQGLELRDVRGQEIGLPSDLLRNVARSYQLLSEKVRHWTWTLLPERVGISEQVALNPKHDLRLRPPSARLMADAGYSNSLEFALKHKHFVEVDYKSESDVYGIALALAKLSDEQFLEFARIVGESSSSRSNPLSHFALAEMHQWAQFQFFEGWKWRKSVEPGGTGHPALVDEGEYQGVPARDVIFVDWLALGQLEILATQGAATIRHLKRAGDRLHLEQANLDIGEFVEPLRGIPLKRGGRVVIDPQALDHLAYLLHLNWLQKRELTWDLPLKFHHQPPRDVHVRWDPDTPNDLQWNPDRVTVYGLAYTISSMCREVPSLYNKLVRAAHQR